MFNFFKKKETKYSVHAVANGTTVALKDVPESFHLHIFS